MNGDLLFLQILSLLSRLWTWCIIYFFASFSQFDASAGLVDTSALAQPMLRWDMFHFLHIAEHGYVFEYEWAFFPGVPFIMRHSAQVLTWMGYPKDYILGGASLALACDSTAIMYYLSLDLLHSPKLAFLATLLSLLSSSPSTSKYVSYAEPFFAFFSNRGMYYCNRGRWVLGSISFTLAATLRSNGIFLAGFVLWGLIIEPLLLKKKVHMWNALLAIACTGSIFSPFMYHHFTAYMAFCVPTASSEWCTSRIPLIYPYVQSKYWDNGFLRYWTIQQIPNFVIASPPLLAMGYFGVWYLRKIVRTPQLNAEDPFTSFRLLPHVLYSLYLCFVLVFMSHTQIILRFASGMPLVHWAAAHLLLEHPKMGAWWVGWSIIWGAVSTMAWSLFLPPA